MRATIIRQAIVAAVFAVRQLQMQWSEERSVYGFAPASEEQIEKAIGVYFWVAETECEIVGFVSGSTHISEGTAVVPEGESYLEVEDLYVLPQFRRQGVGGRLVDQLLIQARQDHIGYALLYSATKDVHGVLRFYERHDFQSWYIQMFQKL